MNSKDVIVETYQTVIDPDIQERLNKVDEYWAGKSLRDVVNEMPEPTRVAIDDMRDVQLVEVTPNEVNHDTSRDIVLGLPYLNGYTPHHYIRAKTLQILAGENHSVWIMPNSVAGKPAYTFTTEQKSRLATGNIQPLGEVQSLAFEKIDHTSNRHGGLGALSITGYSQGALTALAMGAVGSMLPIERINADEAPSVVDRSAKQLSKDFMKSGGLGDLRGAIKDASIRSLSQAMNMGRLAPDLIRFGLNAQKKDAKLLNQAMSGSAEYLVRKTLDKGIFVKLGYVAGSVLFDPESITSVSDNLETVRYEGENFNRKHATGDNVKLHGLMADQGLRRG